MAIITTTVPKVTVQNGTEDTRISRCQVTVLIGIEDTHISRCQANPQGNIMCQLLPLMIPLWSAWMNGLIRFRVQSARESSTVTIPSALTRTKCAMERTIAATGWTRRIASILVTRCGCRTSSERHTRDALRSRCTISGDTCAMTSSA